MAELNCRHHWLVSPSWEIVDGCYVQTCKLCGEEKSVAAFFDGHDDRIEFNGGSKRASRIHTTIITSPKREPTHVFAKVKRAS